MRKRELEKARNSYATGINTEQLKARVSKELEPIKDAYDVAYQAMQQIEQLIQGVTLEDRPVRAMRELAAAMRDTMGVLIAARAEARDSVRFAAERVDPVPIASQSVQAATVPTALPARTLPAPAAQSADPPAPLLKTEP